MNQKFSISLVVVLSLIATVGIVNAQISSNPIASIDVSPQFSDINEDMIVTVGIYAQRPYFGTLTPESLKFNLHIAVDKSTELDPIENYPPGKWTIKFDWGNEVHYFWEGIEVRRITPSNFFPSEFIWQGVLKAKSNVFGEHEIRTTATEPDIWNIGHDSAKFYKTMTIPLPKIINITIGNMIVPIVNSTINLTTHLKTDITCSYDSDCVGKIFCLQMIGYDTPRCIDEKCVCGPKPLEIEIKLGEVIPITGNFKLETVAIEKPKLFNLITIPWAKPIAKVKIYEGDKELETKVIKEGSSISISGAVIRPITIESDKVKFNIKTQ